jgi:hypothetical protein
MDMATSSDNKPEVEEELDRLSPQLDAAAKIIAKLISNYQQHGEQGPQATLAAIEKLGDEQLRILVTALISYAAVHNQAVGEMFLAHEVDGPILH